LNSLKIFIAGANGFIGKSIKAKLLESGYSNLFTPSSSELDYRDSNKTKEYLKKANPDWIIIAAAKVGGIKANIEYPVELIIDNLEIQNSIIRSAHELNINNLLFLSSSCVYPRNSLQPMKEDYILSGKPEPTNESFAIAKIAGMKLIDAYRKQYKRNYFSLIPCNIYGPHDSFDLEYSHFVAALIRKIVCAKNSNQRYIDLWGTGTARRELMFVDDIADAILYFIENPPKVSLLNIGTGIDFTIKEIAEKISTIVNFKGKINFDESYPDGMPIKVMDVSLAKQHNWQSSTDVLDGLRKTIEWYTSVYRL
jgi:GDP-L-fucose synthase